MSCNKSFSRFLFGLALLMFFNISAFAQPANSSQEANPFDYGKMWTFEYAPSDYFGKTYGFNPDEAWLEKAQLGALRFSSFCSASFISKDGLILTNHHCSRGTVGGIMGEGENFDETGFYASTQADERQVPGLYVKQLVQIKDITAKVQSMEKMANSDKEIPIMRDSAIRMMEAELGKDPAWKGLEMESVRYYNGGKYSMYGYKRYDDIRLVVIPELALGYYGGDPDNFTYPRYSLDFTIWRAYEDGKPANTGAHYFPFNEDGAVEDEPVFVVGNPGSTERYRTVAQLEYDRDYRYNILATWLQHRMEIMQEKQKEDPTHDRQEMIFNLSNSIKAFSGIVDGLHDPYLMGKKAAMENMVRTKSVKENNTEDYWASLATEYEKMKSASAENTLLSPSPINGAAVVTAYYINSYDNMLKNEGASDEDKAAIVEQIKASAANLGDSYEVKYLAATLSELQEFADPGEDYIQKYLAGRTPEEAAASVMEKTNLKDADKLAKLFEKPKKFSKSKDPLIVFAREFMPLRDKALGVLQSSTAKRRALEGKVSKQLFNIYGVAIPPDATFTLRLADGIVKGYSYNGTEAPFKTTYYGMYDRHYSNDQEFPWALPERWQNPPVELLQAPLNFVSTNDIIGGNSGSPVINKKGELVGLIFDGNIESLSGNFIYDETINRSVSVHAGGIMAALKYIFKADRIVNELNSSK